MFPLPLRDWFPLRVYSLSPCAIGARYAPRRPEPHVVGALRPRAHARAIGFLLRFTLKSDAPSMCAILPSRVPSSMRPARLRLERRTV
eukprot:2171654-Pyramimonas_sp.AAC.1